MNHEMSLTRAAALSSDVKAQRTHATQTAHKIDPRSLAPPVRLRLLSLFACHFSNSLESMPRFSTCKINKGKQRGCFLLKRSIDLASRLTNGKTRGADSYFSSQNCSENGPVAAQPLQISGWSAGKPITSTPGRCGVLTPHLPRLSPGTVVGEGVRGDHPMISCPMLARFVVCHYRSGQLG